MKIGYIYLLILTLFKNSKLFHNDDKLVAKHSLYKQEKSDGFKLNKYLNSSFKLGLIIFVGSIIIAILIFLFCPVLDSGFWYRQMYLNG